MSATDVSRAPWTPELHDSQDDSSSHPRQATRDLVAKVGATMDGKAISTIRSSSDRA